MQTLDQIGQKYFPCDCGEIYLSRDLTAPDCPYHSFDWESAMQEYAKQIAALAFDAGQNYQGEQTEYGGVKRTAPDKEQFLKQLFSDET